MSSIEKTAVILIIGNTEGETRNLADALGGDYHISAAPNLKEAARRLGKETFSAIIYDLANEGSDLNRALKTLQRLSPTTPVIVIGQVNDAQLIVGAIKAGAFDFLTRPCPPEKIKLSVHQALENRSLKNRIV